jgi:hypothetical protein
MSATLKRALALAGLAAGLSVFVLAQAPAPYKPDLVRMAAGRGAQLYNRSLTGEKDGARAVARLDARAGDGGALLDGVLMGDGVIEVDLRGKNVPQQSFLGIAFHVVDWTTYDAVYFRPFNFRAATEEQRSHAVQFISHPVNTWQKLRAERPGQFEKSIDPPPDPTAWFHARIVVAKGKVEVYVNQAVTPSLVVDDLGEAKSGGVALWAGNGSDGAFANLSILQTAPPGPAPASRQTIFQAAGTGNLARLKALVEGEGVAVGERMPNGLTALHLAAVNDQRSAAEYLLAKGADINAVARHSGTPLDLAYESGNVESARWLESKGARVTPLGFDVATLTPAIHRVAFPWGMMKYFPKDGVVAMGDLLLSESTPALSDIAGYFSFLDDVLDVFPEKTLFVSGHGRDLDAAGVRAYRDTLVEMVGVVRTNLVAGRTAEQMVKDNVLSAYRGKYSLLEFLNPDALIPRVVTALQSGALK